MRNALRSTSFTKVVRFFSPPADIEEDEYEEYMEIAKTMQFKETIYFASAFDRGTIETFKQAKIIDRTPSVLLYNTKIDIDSMKRVGDEEEKQDASTASSSMALEDMYKEQSYISGNLDEMYESRRSLQDWIQQHTVPLVGKLTNTNFQLYDKIGKPMLMLFLDLQVSASLSHSLSLSLSHTHTIYLFLSLSIPTITILPILTPLFFFFFCCLDSKLFCRESIILLVPMWLWEERLAPY